jgi:hypothetical protein
MISYTHFLEISFTILTRNLLHTSLQRLFRFALCAGKFATCTGLASPSKVEADEQLDKAPRLCCSQGASKS